MHETGSTWHIATWPEEDRVTTAGNTRDKFGEVRVYISETLDRTDRRTDRQAHHNTPLPYINVIRRVMV